MRSWQPPFDPQVPSEGPKCLKGDRAVAAGMKLADCGYHHRGQFSKLLLQDAPALRQPRRRFGLGPAPPAFNRPMPLP